MTQRLPTPTKAFLAAEAALAKAVGEHPLAAAIHEAFRDVTPPTE